MRIDAQYGADTDMYLVDVYLETHAERALDAEGIWQSIRPLLDSVGVSVSGVVDFFLYAQDETGTWVSKGLLPW
jgi:hypothetical protein